VLCSSCSSCFFRIRLIALSDTRVAPSTRFCSVHFLSIILAKSLHLYFLPLFHKIAHVCDNLSALNVWRFRI
jgi:hypothetical protein